MKKLQVFFWAFLCLLLFLGNGCAGFRELFSDPGAEKRRAEKRQQRKSDAKKSLQSSRYNRDPLDDIFMRDPKQREDWSKNSNLTDEEKALMRSCNSVWGCDSCQLACPENAKVMQTHIDEFKNAVKNATVSPVIIKDLSF